MAIILFYFIYTTIIFNYVDYNKNEFIEIKVHCKI